MIDLVSQFHFLRPWWLLALPIGYLLLRSVGNRIQSVWSQHIDAEFIDVLKVTPSGSAATFHWLLIWVLMCIALAGPTWSKTKVPTVKSQNALIILLDLSPSMMAQDVKPSRLARARFKLIDILNQRKDGQTALIAYAGDAYTVSPLTNDAKTIAALVPELSPAIMPQQGSNVEAAVLLAVNMVESTGIANSEILLVTDGISGSAMRTLKNQIGSNYSLSILAVGKESTTPIPSVNGGILKQSSGEAVTTRLDMTAFRNQAQELSAHLLRLDEIGVKDLEQLAPIINNGWADESEAGSASSEQESSDGFVWMEQSHWLALALLPFIVFGFRKGMIFSLAIIFVPIVPTGYANEPEQVEVNESLFSSVWKNRDQRAQEMFNNGQHALAANTFENQHWQAAALYQAKQYEKAAELFTQWQDAESQFNAANAYALSGQLETAIEHLDRVLEQSPDHQQAQKNKELLQNLLDSQEQNSEEQNGQMGEQSEQQDSQNQDDGQDSEQNQDGSEQESQPEGSESQSEQNNSSQENQKQQNQASDNEPSDSGEPESQDNPQDEQENSESSKSKSDPETEGEDAASLEQQSVENQEGEQGENEAEEEIGLLQEGTTKLNANDEEWLQSLPEDQGGFLRRKFYIQSQQRQGKGQNRAQNGAQERRY